MQAAKKFMLALFTLNLKTVKKMRDKIFFFTGDSFGSVIEPIHIVRRYSPENYQIQVL